MCNGYEVTCVQLMKLNLLTFRLTAVLITHPLKNATVVFFGLGFKISPLKSLAGILHHNVFYFLKYQCMGSSTLPIDVYTTIGNR